MVWLDSALAGPGSESLLAACPDQVLTGGLADWPDFAERLEAFRRRHAGSAVVGWVAYSGQFRFACYRQPLVYHHDAGEWHLPAGAPDWLPPASEASDLPPAWTAHLDFAAELDEERFCRMVDAAQAHIAAGDIYQVNLAHRFQAAWPSDADSFALYCALRRASPAPQAAYLAFEDGPTVLCSSPEEFMRFDGQHVRTRPIKGTRPRARDAAADAQAAKALLASAKERAELLMITDLMRNDLGQVCAFGEVRVPELFRAEAFAQVHHLVATVTGELRAGVSHAAALHACLPGGSITGAPKQRAREIIAQLEPVERGLYTGVIGCFGFGRPDASRFNIAIRTLLLEDGRAHFHVGAGIVADSIPVDEWQETLDKAAGILQAAGIKK